MTSWPLGTWSIKIQSYDDETDAFVVSYHGVCSDTVEHAKISANLAHKTLILSCLGEYPRLWPDLN